MYPKKLSKSGVLSHSGVGVQDVVKEKLYKDYGQGQKINEYVSDNMMNIFLIQLINAYVNDFFTKQITSTRQLKVLKDEVIAQLSKSAQEKHSIIQHLTKLYIQHQQQKQAEQQKVVIQEKKDEQQQSQVMMVQECEEEKQDVEHTKSIYQNGDEWAALVNYDAEQYKREQEEELRKQQELRKQIKESLDQQINLKRTRLKAESLDERSHNEVVAQKLREYDEKEMEKATKLRKQIEQEKRMRDDQVKLQLDKKVNEQKKQQEQDAEEISKIREGLQQEQVAQIQKRKQERERFQNIIKENELLRKSALEEMKKERDNEIKMQSDYIQTLKNIEDKRERENKTREDRIKNIMNNFSQQVLSNTKDQQRKEDEMRLEQIRMQEELEIQDELRRKKEMFDKQSELREFLGKQVQDRESQKNEEKLQNKRYIEQRELLILSELEKQRRKETVKKYEEVKNAKLKLAEDVKEQIQYSKKSQSQVSRQNRYDNSMSREELLHNKSRLKVISNNSSIVNLRKSKISIS